MAYTRDGPHGAAAQTDLFKTVFSVAAVAGDHDVKGRTPPAFMRSDDGIVMKLNGAIHHFEIPTQNVQLEVFYNHRAVAEVKDCVLPLNSNVDVIGIGDAQDANDVSRTIDVKPALDCVIAACRFEDKRIRACLPKKLIIALSSEQPVISVSAEKGIRAGGAHQNITSSSAP